MRKGEQLQAPSVIDVTIGADRSGTEEKSDKKLARGSLYREMLTNEKRSIRKRSPN